MIPGVHRHRWERAEVAIGIVKVCERCYCRGEQRPAAAVTQRNNPAKQRARATPAPML
jgi:hypothetical protein